MNLEEKLVQNKVLLEGSKARCVKLYHKYRELKKLHDAAWIEYTEEKEYFESLDYKMAELDGRLTKIKSEEKTKSVNSQLTSDQARSLVNRLRSLHSDLFENVDSIIE